MRLLNVALTISVLSLCWSANLNAQYFGRNKANYQSFDFRVYQTPNFEIYHYLEDQEVLNTIADWSEQWYEMHQRILRDTIRQRNPFILYNNHADFQQTNAIMGSIGVGTGGVTEAFKNRVILPFAMSNQQTFHVLGHELVHAFQYNMILANDSTSFRNLGNLPLWMVEGLAEYMSIGSVDAHTAMWMRDAVFTQSVPPLRMLFNPRFFPYRYGQAFWAFLAGMKGDHVIAPFFKATALYGLEIACQQVLGMTLDNLSELWVNSIKRQYEPYMRDRKEQFMGRKLIGEDSGGGRLNISPVISPNGRYLIFLSERDLFTTDLYLADVSTGRIIRKVASAARDGHIDDFNYIESAGAWSPDSKEFVFVGFSRGRNILIFKNVENGRTVMETPLEGVLAFSNPTWSPDGRTVVVSGLVQGRVNLYAFDIRNKRVTQLTNDSYSQMHPHFSDDGARLYYSTDELSMRRGRVNGKWVFNLAVYDMVSGRSQNIDIFPGADNLNPVADPQGNIIFLSNRDGFRNIYMYQPGYDRVYQLTDYIVGVSGITHYAPALSVARRRDRLVYTYYSDNRYTVYSARPEDYLMKEVDPNDVNFAAATLPRVNPRANDLVDAQLERVDQFRPSDSWNYAETRYRPQFKLDYVGGSAGVGVGTSNAFGTTSGVAGGVDLLFSDILGNNTIFTSIAMNGEIYDFGGTAAFINRKSRINWGASVSHIPFRSGFAQYAGIDTLQLGSGFVLADRWELFIQRFFEQRVGAFAAYPFSTIFRLEGQANFTRYTSRIDLFNNYYDFFGQLIKQQRERLESPPGFNLSNAGLAFVGDNSFFGLTAPLQGHRFRVGVDRYYGTFNFWSPTLDYRRYMRMRPVTVAFRAMHIGRYGEEGNQLFPYFIGFPTFIRGYDARVAQSLITSRQISEDNLRGSKIAVGNFEIRIPFTGIERLSLIKSNFLFSDLNFFFDAGLTWYDFDQFRGDVSLIDGTRYDKALPLFSYGASLRINLFGAMVLEPYYAIPIVPGRAQGAFGLNIFPGW
jgi:hypothetical protein